MATFQTGDTPQDEMNTTNDHEQSRDVENEAAGNESLEEEQEGGTGHQQVGTISRSKGALTSKGVRRSKHTWI